MNLIEIAGHLGADPEERFTSTGKRVVTIRVATRVRQGGKDETIWWRVNMWGDRFNSLLPYLRKGSAIIIVGEMAKPEIYQDKEGKPQISLTITAEIVRFSPFGKGKEGGSERSEEKTTYMDRSERAESFASAGAMTGGISIPEDSGFTGDDLPF